MKIKMYSDGGARNNPGMAGIGVVAFDENNNKLFEISKYIGETTNNIAEYTALFEGLKKTLELKSKIIDCFLDSELVVKQLNGIYKIKNEELKKIYNQIKKIILNFEQVNFIHIKREKNKQADELVNKAIDLALSI